MSNALIFDTEATGLDEPELIEAAWIRFNHVDDLAGESDRIPGLFEQFEQFEQRYKPLKDITFGAMAVHHILPHELDDCPPSDSFVLPADIDYIVGHNIDFDWGVIGRPNVKRICTDAMARYVWQNADSYSQSALLYMQRGSSEQTRQELKDAHSALADVQNGARLLDCILGAKQDIDTWAALYEFSEQCRIPRVMPLGKLKGELVREAPTIDWGYCQWLLGQDWLDDYLRLGLEMAINNELPEEDG